MNNFTQRTLSGTVYVAVVVSSILVHPMYFGIVFGIITMLAVREYLSLMKVEMAQIVINMVAAGILFSLGWCMANPHVLGPNAAIGFTLLLPIYCLFLLGSLIAELFLKNEQPISQWGYILQSQLMVALPFALMNLIMLNSAKLLLALFITIWINDTGAYVVGSLMSKRAQGNHKMFPRVSPKKSWEGLIGGIFFALISGYIYFSVGWIHSLPIALTFAFVISIFGTLGDLMESLMKRSIGIKDSGNFLPGHGGVLDRFDSILLATPAIVLFLYILQLFA